MRVLTILLFLSIVHNLSFAQSTSNLIIYASDSIPFYAIVNGQKQNDSALVNLKISGLTDASNDVKVKFVDQNIPDLEKQLFFQEMNVEATLKVSDTKSGYKLRYFGEVSMGAAPPNPSQVEIAYHDSNIKSSDQTEESGVQNNQTDSYSKAPVSSHKVNAPTENTSSFQTDETNMSAVESMPSEASVLMLNDSILTNDSLVIPDNYSFVTNYSGPFGCERPTTEFTGIINQIQAEPFSEKRLAKAKKIIESKCLTTNQVRQIIEIMEFEDNRLDFAKFAYQYTYDTGNYLQLTELFNFSNSKKSLTNYIKNNNE